MKFLSVLASLCWLFANTAALAGGSLSHGEQVNMSHGEQANMGHGEHTDMAMASMSMAGHACDHDADNDLSKTTHNDCQDDNCCDGICLCKIGCGSVLVGLNNQDVSLLAALPPQNRQVAFSTAALSAAPLVDDPPPRA